MITFSFSWDYTRRDFRVIFSFTQDKNFYENLELHSHTWCPRYNETDLIPLLLELVEKVNQKSLPTRKVIRCYVDPEYSITESGVEKRWGDARIWFPLTEESFLPFEILIKILCEISFDKMSQQEIGCFLNRHNSVPRILREEILREMS